ncbi:Rho GTPase [Pelomyxa schiedti]|nr:Rho GTPase [Pelomyxa schiedti]
MTEPTPGTQSIKLVVVGDGAVGKTCLLITYANHEFPKTYVPTVFDNYVVTLTAGNRNIELTLWDTAGQEEYDRLRPLSYSNTNVFLICFAITNPVSLENVIAKWHPEIIHFSPADGVPYILIGTKVDGRNDPDAIAKLKTMGQTIVTYDQGNEVAQRIKALKYIECSAKSGDNLKLVFDEAIKAVLFNKGKKRKRCSVM